jgi:hypothetical protein
LDLAEFVHDRAGSRLGCPAVGPMTEPLDR